MLELERKEDHIPHINNPQVMIKLNDEYIGRENELHQAELNEYEIDYFGETEKPDADVGDAPCTKEDLNHIIEKLENS